MRKVCRDYAAIFDEVEQKPSCSVQWHLAKHAVVGKPQFVPVDRRNCVRVDAAKSEEPTSSDVKLPLMENYIDGELQPVHFQADSMRTNLELLNNHERAISVPQTSDMSPTDLPGALEKQQGHELDGCSVDNHDRNYEHISVDHRGKDNCDTASVINDVALQEKSQAPGTGVPGTVSLPVLFNSAGFAISQFQTVEEILNFFHLNSLCTVK